MISSYWRHIFVGPMLVGLVAICLISIPFVFWELGKWRLVFLGKPLPRWVALRVLVPIAFASFLYLSIALLFAVFMTHFKLQMHSTSERGIYDVFVPFSAVIIAVSAPRVVQRLLKSPYVLPSGGTYRDSHLPWTVDASGFDGISRHNML